jgi:hypothetical protein
MRGQTCPKETTERDVQRTKVITEVRGSLSQGGYWIGTDLNGGAKASWPARDPAGSRGVVGNNDTGIDHCLDLIRKEIVGGACLLFPGACT